MEDVLITGATGFVGRRLVARLAERCRVWAVARRVPDSNTGPIRWIRHDFRHPAPPMGLPRRIDAVIHLAQSAHYRDFPDHAAEIHAVSAGACMALLDWARRAGASRFVVASTGGLYDPQDAVITDDTPLGAQTGPLRFYFASKRTCELLAEPYASFFQVSVLRFFFVYGSGQNPAMLMPRLVAAVSQSRPIHLQGPEGMRLNPIHVEDAIRVIEGCLDSGRGGTFNIAGPEVASLRSIGRLIGALVGRDPVLHVDDDARPGHLVVDIAPMAARFGPPRVGLGDGLAELCGAARSGEETA